MLENLLLGFQTIAHWQPILGILAGIAIGYFVGIMPGLSASTGMAILVPVTFTMPPVVAISMLVTIYAASEYGNSITSITVNTPGTPGAIATCWDGYEFTKRGEPAKALAISIIASTLGAYFSYVILVAFTEPIARFAIRLGSPEYAMLGLFALTIVASLVGKSWIKGVLSAIAGLMIAMVGIDVLSGAVRFTYGQPYLLEGIAFVPILIGLCAIAEALHLMDKPVSVRQKVREMSGAFPTRAEVLRLKMTYLRGSIIGTAIGIVPGAGAAIASIVAYNEEKRASRHPELFGTGVLEGVAAPEAANNATVGGSLIPLLSLGIPGSNSTAILIGALTMQGIVPGPMLMSRNTDLVYGVFAALIVGSVVMLILGLALTKVWTKVLRVPVGILAPLILGTSVIGSYAYGNNFSDVIIAVTFGIIGLYMRKNDIPYAPLILAVVIGEMIETNFRRSLMMSQGSYDIFVTRPMSALLLALTLFALLFPLYRWWKTRNSMKNGQDA